MTTESEVAISKATAATDLKSLDAGTSMHRAFSEQTDAEFVDCWIADASHALEVNLRVQMKKQS